MLFQLECKYCGAKWERQLYTSNAKANCYKCGDSNVKFKELAQHKVDYYKGTPAFREEDEEAKKKEDEMYDYYLRSD